MTATKKNQLAALGLINREPMHGYRLNQLIAEIGIDQWTTLSQSSIYNALSRLAERGAVTTTTEREGKAPERTVYHIAPEGKELLADLLREALSHVGPEDRLFYLGFTFAESLPAGEIASLLRERRGRILYLIENQRRCGEAIDTTPQMKAMTLAGRRHMEVETDLCAELIELYRGEKSHE